MPQRDTPIYSLSDRFIDEMAELDPLAATYLGIAGFDHLMTDFSPAGHDARAEHAARTLGALNALIPTDDADRLAAGVLRNDLELSIAEHAAGEHLRSIRVIAGDLDGARSVFDLMPTDTEGDWENIASRMEAFPMALEGMRASWRQGVASGCRRSGSPGARSGRTGIGVGRCGHRRLLPDVRGHGTGSRRTVAAPASRGT